MKYAQYKELYQAYCESEKKARKIRPHEHNFVGTLQLHELAILGLSVLKHAEEMPSNEK